LVVFAIVLLWLAAYLLGSIPTGYLVAKAVKGIDIREYGSGGTGATNVLRTVGKAAAIAVLLIDMVKGLGAVLLVKAAWPSLETTFAGTAAWQPWVITLAALMTLIGHSRSVWINFTGGKSAASGLGILLGLAWPVALGAVVAFAATLATSRIVSLSSIAAALVTIVLMVATGQPLAYGVLALLGGVYVILRHRSNIDRLLAGTEPRLGQSTSKS
jgi:glycerol-3-phosphate acyltransferase PlsY